MSMVFDLGRGRLPPFLSVPGQLAAAAQLHPSRTEIPVKINFPPSRLSRASFLSHLILLPVLDQLRSLFSEEERTSPMAMTNGGYSSREGGKGTRGNRLLDESGARLAESLSISTPNCLREKRLFVRSPGLRQSARVIWFARISSIDCSTLTDTSVSGCPSVLAPLGAMQIEANLDGLRPPWLSCLPRYRW